MKKIISNKMYDTETAKKIASQSHGEGPRDINYCCETLYKKRTGEYFLHGEGGPASKYAESRGLNQWTGGEMIIPLDYKSATEWGEENMSADDYQAEFGEVSEGDEERTSVTISLSVATLERIRREASKNGMGISAVIASKF